MIEKSLAHPSTESTTGGLEHVSPIAQRVLRGQRLFREHAEQMLFKRGIWYIPATREGVGYYAVRLGPVESCECSDYGYRGGRCKHIHAATIAQAKSRTCSCCGYRALGRFLSTVEESDNLLSWFVGDELCADCISQGYWS